MSWGRIGTSFKMACDVGYFVLDLRFEATIVWARRICPGLAVGVQMSFYCLLQRKFFVTMDARISSYPQVPVDVVSDLGRLLDGTVSVNWDAAGAAQLTRPPILTR